MEAGRELDALVAEKVMGWLRVERVPEAGLWSAPDGGGSVEVRAAQIPRYSTDIAAAWEVVKRVQFRNPGWRVSLMGGDSEFGGWKAEFFGHSDPRHDYGQRHGQAMADTAPRAICLAALRAVGCEVTP